MSEQIQSPLADALGQLNRLISKTAHPASPIGRPPQSVNLNAFHADIESAMSLIQKEMAGLGGANQLDYKIVEDVKQVVEEIRAQIAATKGAPQALKKAFGKRLEEIAKDAEADYQRR